MVEKKVRAHSKFSASGAERWFNCPGSVELSEGQPDKTSVWAEEGTLAHEVLEYLLLQNIGIPSPNVTFPKKVPPEMVDHAIEAVNFIATLWRELPDADILVETRIYLEFIHPEMFGTFDSAVIDHFGTLHIFDYKYGAGHSVSVKDNLQMIFYGLGMAHKYNWNFNNVRLWIIQPRIRGYDGPTFWDIPILELRKYVVNFKEAVQGVKDNPKDYYEGSWCWWCKAKSVCPLKLQAKLDSAKDIFKATNPVDKSKHTDENFY